jgi:hypothetical protein
MPNGRFVSQVAQVHADNALHQLLRLAVHVDGPSIQVRSTVLPSYIDKGVEAGLQETEQD